MHNKKLFMFYKLLRLYVLSIIIKLEVQNFQIFLFVNMLTIVLDSL